MTTLIYTVHYSPIKCGNFVYCCTIWRPCWLPVRQRILFYVYYAWALRRIVWLCILVAVTTGQSYLGSRLRHDLRIRRCRPLAPYRLRTSLPRCHRPCNPELAIDNRARLLCCYCSVSPASAKRKPCCRKETARCRSCSFRFKVRRQHSLQVWE